MAKKIFFGNYKGGVGKTTSTFYIAKQFAEFLKEQSTPGKVLIIDLDPQCSMSEICVRSYDSNLSLSELPDNETLNYMLDMLLKNKKYNTTLKFNFSNIIKPCTGLNTNVEFIPTSLFYKENRYPLDPEIIGLDGLIEKLQMDMDKNLLLLHEIIALIEDTYEYIFFDCPPTNNILTKSAFLLSDYYIIPYISDNISIKGVQHYINTVDRIYNNYCKSHPDADFYQLIFNNQPELLGLFECMRIRNENARGNIGEINAKRYKTVIKNLIGIQEALSSGKTTEEFGLYKELAIEIFDDLKGK
jgi:cellulose biosynthesis protein BcsQ